MFAPSPIHWIILWGSPSLLRDVSVLWGSPVVPLYYLSAFVRILEPFGVFADRGWTLILVFEVAVSVLCWLELWDSCLAHLPNGKWHLSWCLLSEGVVLGRWCYWPVSRALGWLKLVLHISCLNLCAVLWCCHVQVVGAGAAIPWNRPSSAALPKAPNQAVGAALASTSWSIPLAWVILWDTKWRLHPSGLHWGDLFLSLAVAVHRGLIWSCVAGCDQDVLPSAMIHQLSFGLVLSAGCEGESCHVGAASSSLGTPCSGQLPALLQQSKPG